MEEEISKLTIVHDKLQTTLDREREKCEKTEEDLKTTADSLKKQLKDEAHARTVLQVSFYYPFIHRGNIGPNTIEELIDCVSKLMIFKSLYGLAPQYMGDLFAKIPHFLTYGCLK